MSRFLLPFLYSSILLRSVVLVSVCFQGSNGYHDRPHRRKLQQIARMDGYDIAL